MLLQLKLLVVPQMQLLRFQYQVPARKIWPDLQFFDEVIGFLIPRTVPFVFKEHKG